MGVSNRNPLFRGSIFRFYLSFLGGVTGVNLLLMIHKDYEPPDVFGNLIQVGDDDEPSTKPFLIHVPLDF